MVNFERLVSCILFERDEQNNQDADVDSQATGIRDIFKEKYKEIKPAYEKAFGVYFENGLGTFPSETDFDLIVYNAAADSLRDTKGKTYASPTETIFPLLDLIALAKEAHKTSSVDNKRTSTLGVIDNFITNLKSYEKSNKFPLSYTASSPWAKELRDTFIKSKGAVNIGELKLGLKDSKLQTKSFYDLLIALLEDRRTSKIKLINREIQIGSALSTIEQVLQNPDRYLQGIPFPDKKLSAIYGPDVQVLLRDVAFAGQALFKQQYVEKVGTEPPNNSERLLIDFWKNSIDWEALKKQQVSANTEDQNAASPSPTSTLQQASFDYTLSSIFKQILNEETSPEIRSKVLSSLVSSQKARKSSKFGKPVKNPEQQQQQQQVNFPENQYTLKTLLQAKDNKLPEAEALYISLEKIADFIRKEAESIDWAGVISGAEQIAKGLSLGVPTMGR